MSNSPNSKTPDSPGTSTNISNSTLFSTTSSDCTTPCLSSTSSATNTTQSSPNTPSISTIPRLPTPESAISQHELPLSQGSKRISMDEMAAEKLIQQFSLFGNIADNPRKQDDALKSLKKSYLRGSAAGVNGPTTTKKGKLPKSLVDADNLDHLSSSSTPTVRLTKGETDDDSSGSLSVVNIRTSIFDSDSGSGSDGSAATVRIPSKTKPTPTRKSLVQKPKRKKKRKYDRFYAAIYKTLKSHSPLNEISKQAVFIMDDFMNDMLRRIAGAARSLMRIRGKRQMSSWDMKHGARLVLPRQLAMEADFFATKSLMRFERIR